MAKLTLPVIVNIPDNLEINLIRSDYFDVGNIFRISFEIGLAIFSGIIGYFLSAQKIDALAIIFLSILVIVIAFSLFFYTKYYRKSLLHEVESEEGEEFLSNRNFSFYLNIKLEQQTVTAEKLRQFNPELIIKWHPNSIKTDYITLRIYSINNSSLTRIIKLLKDNNIQFKDEKIIL